MGFFRQRTDLTRHRRLAQPSDRPTAGMTYYSRRSEEAFNTGRNVQREAKRRLNLSSLGRFWLHRFGLGLLVIVSLICLLYMLSLSANPKIVFVTNTTPIIHSQATYQAAATKLLASSIWNRNKLTVNTVHVSSQLQHQFPELTSVNMVLPLLAHRPMLYLQLSPPALILNSASGAYVLDADGKALAIASQSLTDLSLPVVADQSGLPVSLNHQVLTPDDISFIQTVIAQLAARHFSVSGMNLPAAASELDVRLVGQPYFVKFNLESGDARQQAGTFLAVQNHLQGEHITPAQYIDVRVDGRAYYK